MRTVGTAARPSGATRTCAPMSASPGASSNGPIASAADSRSDASARPSSTVVHPIATACTATVPGSDAAPAPERRLHGTVDRGLERPAHPISSRSGAGRPRSSKPTRR